ncbi:MAG: hypothetical protein ACI9J3_002209 [Parvicellaceae bacterium]|jgi:hypothetical protein
MFNHKLSKLTEDQKWEKLVSYLDSGKPETRKEVIAILSGAPDSLSFVEKQLVNKSYVAKVGAIQILSVIGSEHSAGLLNEILIGDQLVLAERAAIAILKIGAPSLTVERADRILNQILQNKTEKNRKIASTRQVTEDKRTLSFDRPKGIEPTPTRFKRNRKFGVIGIVAIVVAISARTLFNLAINSDSPTHSALYNDCGDYYTPTPLDVSVISKNDSGQNLFISINFIPDIPESTGHACYSTKYFRRKSIFQAKIEAFKTDEQIINFHTDLLELPSNRYYTHQYDFTLVKTKKDWVKM